MRQGTYEWAYYEAKFHKRVIRRETWPLGTYARWSGRNLKVVDASDKNLTYAPTFEDRAQVDWFST